MSERQKRLSARNENCSVRLPGCPNDIETTVYAHLNLQRFGKGIGIKSKFGAYADHHCHTILDGGKTHLSRTEIENYHLAGCLETMLKLEEKGLVKL